MSQCLIAGLTSPKHFPSRMTNLANPIRLQLTGAATSLFIQKNEVLVGNGGFTGSPDESGTVEIGYEIASEYWNRGFATEVAQGMIDYAFAHEDVKAVIAHTLAEKKCLE
jgi:RimJ/RimL family protein N-acetyltransferase